MTTTYENHIAPRQPCPSETEFYPDARDVYYISINIQNINEWLPKDQVQVRIPDYVHEAICKLQCVLPRTDDSENKKRVTPDLLLELLGPITARTLVIAAIYVEDIVVRKNLAVIPNLSRRFSSKWSFVARGLGIGEISW